MKKFMKITIGIVAEIAMVAITMAIAYGVNSVWGDVGVYALLGVALVGWIVAGFILDKQALAYTEMQANLAVSEGEMVKLREKLAQSGADLKRACSVVAELQKLCDDSEAKLKAISIDRDEKEVELNKYKAAWEEATKREEMLHKQLREKQGVVEYFRSRYNALKSEAEARKTDEGVFVGTDLSADKDVECEATVEVPLAKAKVEEVETESVEVAVAPAPNYPRRHKIKRQLPKPAQS